MGSSTSWLAALRQRLGFRPGPVRGRQPQRFRPELQVLEGRSLPSVNGLIAFQTSRDGNPEIYSMNPDGSGQTNLTNHPDSDVEPAWSPDGTKIAFASTRDGSFDIFVMAADGSGQTNLTNHPALDGQAAWSPDGTKIAFTSTRDGNLEIYVMNADGSEVNRLTNHPENDGTPAWSPDGAKIAFTSLRDGIAEIYVMNADGSGLTNLTNHPGPDLDPVWSPDGTKIAFHTPRDFNFEIYVMNADGSGQTNLTNHPAHEQQPNWSPDGTKIAFLSTRDGAAEVYVMNADGSGQVNLTNNPEVDGVPSWGPMANRAPTITVPGAQTAFKNVDKSISGITVGDPDGGNLMVTLGVAHGTLTLGTTTGLTVTGNGSGAVSLAGSIANLNAALATLIYRGVLNYSGADTLNISASDGSLSTSGSVAITVTNRPPELAAPGAQTAFEDVDKSISGITVGDPDGDNLTVTLGVVHGTLTLGTTAGLTVTGNGSGAVSLAGSITDLNAALATLVYRGILNYSGADTLNISASDGSLTTSGSVAIAVKSSAQQADGLAAQVDALVAAGVLNEGQGGSLKLNLKDNNGDAGKVQAFLNHVSAFLSAGILTQAQADALLGPGNILLLSVTRR